MENWNWNWDWTSLVAMSKERRVYSQAKFLAPAPTPLLFDHVKGRSQDFFRGTYNSPNAPVPSPPAPQCPQRYCKPKRFSAYEMTSLSNMKKSLSPFFWVHWLKHLSRFHNSRLRFQTHRDAFWGFSRCFSLFLKLINNPQRNSLISVWKSDEKLLVFALLISPSKIILFETYFNIKHLT